MSVSEVNRVPVVEAEVGEPVSSTLLQDIAGMEIQEGADRNEAMSSSLPEDAPQKSGRRIRWHEGENFLHEFDDSHLWLHDPNETAKDMTDRYKAECANAKIRPIAKLLEQLERLDDPSTPIDTLDLKGVRLDNRSCEVLEAVLSRVQMVTLDLQRTNLEDEGAIALCEMIEFYGCASRVILSGNSRLHPRAWLTIGRMLKKSPFINMISVSYCTLEEQTLTLLLRSVRANCALQVLRLEGNNLTGKGTFILTWEAVLMPQTHYHPDTPTADVLGSIEDGMLMDPPDYCPDSVYDLMCLCWEMEPRQRPSFLTLQEQLARVPQGTGTPGSSPMLTRRPMPPPNVDELVNSPVAVKAYREAPINRKTTLFLSNLFLIGPQASGKTSLLRSLTGESFRLVEPPSRRIDLVEEYSYLADSVSWLPSVSGLVYEDELVRIIVEDLLKHVSSGLSSSSRGGQGSVAGIREWRGEWGDRPPLPPRQRSLSFSEVRGNVNLEGSDSSASRLSGDFEPLDSGSFSSAAGRLETDGRPRHFHVAKKSALTKFLNRSFRHSKQSKKVQRHHSDSSKHMLYTGRGSGTNHAPSTSSSSSTSPTPPPPVPHSSPLPERVTEKLRQELSECTGSTLPPRYLARLIDTPGHPSFRVLQTLFLTENSLCLLVFDASRDILAPPPSSSFSSSSLSLKRKQSPDAKQHANHHSPTSEDSYLLHIMAEITNVCVQWSGFKTDLTVCGPRIILVGTHSDKVSSSATHRNFEILRDEIRTSSYEKYVATAKFVVSNSSIIERSSLDELKQFVRESVRKSCRQQVPLKWLRCVRRFQALPKRRSYFIKLSEARKLVSEICDISPADPEIGEVVEFLHRNQVIMHFPTSHHLRDLVISSTLWFSHQVSSLFGAVSVDIAREFGPLELLEDQELLRSTGILTGPLLDYVWREKESQLNKDQLLIVMHKMDLLCVAAGLASSSQEAGPVSATAAAAAATTLSASVEDLTAETGSESGQNSRGRGGRRRLHKHSKLAGVSSLVVPALVEEPAPPHLSSLPSYDVEPVLFRFKAHVPDGLFARLLVRCVQSYPRGFNLYQRCATFELDARSLLLLSEGRDYIKLTLHPNQKSSASPSSPSSLSSSSSHHHHQHQHSIMEFSDIDSILSAASDSAHHHAATGGVSPDTCMAVLMFLRASINDLTQQWTPHLDFDLCVKCRCKLQPIPMDAVVDIDAALAEQRSHQRYRHRPSVTSAAAVGPPHGTEHYVVLNDVDSLLHQQPPPRCNHGNQVPLASSLVCWFGEELATPTTTTTRNTTSPASPLHVDHTEYVTDEDINQVLKVLGPSWKELGRTLGFSQLELEHFSLTTSNSFAYAGKKMLEEWQTLRNRNATFFALLGALEIIQRRDIADELVATRMGGSRDGLAL